MLTNRNGQLWSVAPGLAQSSVATTVECGQNFEGETKINFIYYKLILNLNKSLTPNDLSHSEEHYVVTTFLLFTTRFRECKTGLET